MQLIASRSIRGQAGEIRDLLLVVWSSAPDNYLVNGWHKEDLFYGNFKWDLMANMCRDFNVPRAECLLSDLEGWKNEDAKLQKRREMVAHIRMSEGSFWKNSGDYSVDYRIEDETPEKSGFFNGG